MKTVLSVAGSDPSGGAGIQADLKTILANGIYGMCVLTALTAQNTQGVYGVLNVPPDFVKKQIECVFDDIPPDAVKIGMVSSSALAEAIADTLWERKAKNVVVDPVMAATSGGKLLEENAKAALMEKLFPLARVITPNLLEAEALSGIKIASKSDMERAACLISRSLKGAVLIKGGHLANTADDLLCDQGEITWLKGERIENPNTHGTGCTLSSSIACNLALGFSVLESVKRAKAYVTGAIRAGLDLGKGRGPLDHGFAMQK